LVLSPKLRSLKLRDILASLELRGILAAVVFVGSVIVLLSSVSIFSNKFTEVTTIVAIGFAFYFARAGWLEELTIPGIKFKLREFQKKAISSDYLEIADRIVSGQEIFTESKEPGPSISQQILELVEQKKSNTLTIKKRTVTVASPVLANWLNELSKFPFFRHVIFVDENEKFVGHIFPNTLHYELLRQISNQGGKKIDTIINNWQNDMTRITEIPGVVTEHISEGSTYRSALEKMNNLQLEYIPIADKSGKFAGTISKNQIADELLKILVYA